MRAWSDGGINQISLVHNHDKTGRNFTHWQDNTDTRENPNMCIDVCTKEKQISPAMATHPLWNQEYNQSYPVGSNPGHVTHINRGLGHTKTVKGEY